MLQYVVLEEDEVAALHRSAALEQQVNYMLKVLLVLVFDCYACVPSCPAAATTG